MAYEAKSEITGSVWKFRKQIGDRVAEGDELVILESMKMEIPVQAPVAGVISRILVQEGDIVEEGQTVATLA